MNLSKADLELWISDLQGMENGALGEQKSKADREVYELWLKEQQKKVAPGFNFEIMTPTSATKD